MMHDNDSGGVRLLFWFLWLSGVLLGCYFIAQIIMLGFDKQTGSSAFSFFLGFSWLMVIQLLSLKRYQFLGSSVKPIFILLLGYVVLCACTAIKLTVSA